MREITVKKSDLLEKIKKNKDTHRAIFEEAVEGYRAQAIGLLEDHIAAIKAGKVQRVHISLPQPEDHTNDYDRVLAMLDMELADEITLDEDDFAAYVMDDWVWKRQFLTGNAMYSATAAMLSS